MKQFSVRDTVDRLPGIGPKRAADLQRKGYHTIEDLLQLIPLRYEDRRTIQYLNGLTGPTTALVKVAVGRIDQRQGVRGRSYVTAEISDATGTGKLYWFQRPAKFLLDQLKQRGREVLLYGRVEISRTKEPVFVHPELTLLPPGTNTVPKDECGLFPVYPTITGFSQRLLRRILHQVVQQAKIEETLPEALLQEHILLGRQAAFAALHTPKSPDHVALGRRRLAFEEMLWFQWQVAMMQHHTARQPGLALCAAEAETLIERLLSQLPFQLTSAQQQVWGEIAADLECGTTMSRLVQGDVGSGKTIIAVMAIAKAVANDYQAVLMAPTEILAKQHYYYLQSLFKPLGITVGYLASGVRPKERRRLLADIQAGAISVVIGTHALLQEDVRFQQLALAIIDEQHRFGVEQRKTLQKKGIAPHVLIMSATPIPRTLALICYGDLAVSSINELPPGRKAVKTLLRATNSLPKIYQFIRQQVEEKRSQIYIICPMIEESETSPARSAVELYQELVSGPLRGIPCGLIHGKLRLGDKDNIMDAFHRGAIKVLVSTTVIEVGVNVPTANVMLIVDADRFGLAQLHQLRGRVGRGSEQAYCVLVSDAKSKESQERLQLLTTTNDGFTLAEQDLALRGPGQFFGQAQHGDLGFCYADLIGDMDILLAARTAATTFAAELAVTVARRKQELRVVL